MGRTVRQIVVYLLVTQPQPAHDYYTFKLTWDSSLQVQRIP